MNQIQREPIVNQVQVLVPQSTLTDTGVTGSALDLVNTKRPRHLLLIAAQAFTEVSNASVELQESDEGTTWTRLINFPISGIVVHEIVRTKRRIRAVVRVEPAPAASTPTVPVQILLLS